ncbi:MAG: hypothetical protein RI985_1551 [Chloroflexota bacterium]|jgi:hypothetical protein
MDALNPDYQRDLGDGYRLRWATTDDGPQYAQLAAKAFYLKNEQMESPNVVGYARDLVSNNHPLCHADDVAVVVDGHNQIVAAAALLTQPLEYDGIPLKVGRPELVCSDSQVRQRGFVRAIFELMHAKSAARGDVMQAITGIPHYYHQFGYSWSVDYNAHAKVALAKLPALASEVNPVRLQRVTPAEYQQFVALYNNDRLGRNLLLTTPYTPEYFAHVLTTSVSTEGFIPYFMVNELGSVLGYFLADQRSWDGWWTILGIGAAANQSLANLIVPTLHAAKELTTEIHKCVPHHPDIHSLNIQVDGNHPMQQVLTNRNIPFQYEAPYTWYLRVPDMVKLLGQITPALERRMAQSIFAGYSGKLVLSFFRDGVELEWQNGQLIQLTPWHPPVYEKDGSSANASYPPSIFNQQLFGWRSLAELREWRPDVWADSESTPLLDVLFPKQPSWFLWMN